MRQPQARRACVKPFNIVGRSYYRSALISRSSFSFVTGPMCLQQIEPSRSMMNDIGNAHSGPNAVVEPSCVDADDRIVHLVLVGERAQSLRACPAEHAEHHEAASLYWS